MQLSTALFSCAADEIRRPWISNAIHPTARRHRKSVTASTVVRHFDIARRRTLSSPSGASSSVTIYGRTSEGRKCRRHDHKRCIVSTQKHRHTTYARIRYLHPSTDECCGGQLARPGRQTQRTSRGPVCCRHSGASCSSSGRPADIFLHNNPHRPGHSAASDQPATSWESRGEQRGTP